MEHDRCYIYTPNDTEERAPKRQRTIEPHQLHLSERLHTFREIWSYQEEHIQATLEEADETTQEKIVDFISATAQSEHEQTLTIPTGLIVAGPSIASHGPFFERLGRRLKEETNSAYVVLTSGESPNLKTLLKNLIKKVTSRTDYEDEDDIGRPVNSRNGPKFLDFDLGHLQEWRKKNRVQSIVVAIQDSEAFDAGTLIEMIDLFYSWLNRLPFKLLFGIATSVERFEDRLSWRSLRYLEGQKFDVTQSDEIIEKVFSTTIASPDAPLRIGPNICRRILDRQKDHVQNVQDFTDGLKYAYMSHFYSNVTTIFLKNAVSFKDLSLDAFEAVRNLPSFQKWVDGLLDQGETQNVRNLLDSNQYLFKKIQAHIQAGQQALSKLSHAALVLVHIRQSLELSPNVALSSIWTRAASGEMIGSPLLRETMLSVKKIPSDKLAQLLASLEVDEGDYLRTDLDSFRGQLDTLVGDSTTSTPLRTQHDVRTDSLRTTVVAQKVLLSKHKATLSEQDKSYSDLVFRFHDEIDKYFTETFIDPRTLFLSEVLIYDLRSPHTEIFQPKPRFAIERALTSPHDYLGCNCCGGQQGETTLSTTQPATAILYQLYLESGALINVSDLWSAFNAIVGDEKDDSESRTMALFQRGLAELKHLSLVKPSRKKTDHIAKLMWKGL